MSGLASVLEVFSQLIWREEANRLCCIYSSPDLQPGHILDHNTNHRTDRRPGRRTDHTSNHSSDRRSNHKAPRRLDLMCRQLVRS